MMITGDVVFLDTETTGLGADDQPWEIAAVRRKQDGTEQSLLLQVRHNRKRALDLPDTFRTDYLARYNHDTALTEFDAAMKLIEFLADAPHLVGVNPAFDAAVLGRLLYPFDPPWHYHLIDLPAVTIGYLLARGKKIELPWRSDELSAQVGVPTRDEHGAPRYERHTAMGDVRWTRDWFDALTGGRRRPSGTCVEYTHPRQSSADGQHK